MSASRRALWRSILCLLCTLPAICAAQPGKPQFVLPKVEPTGGQVTSFLVGPLQEPLIQSSDILYINAPTSSGTTKTIVAGELLYKQGFTNLRQNQITFPNVSHVVATLTDFNNDKITDYGFALSPATAADTPTFCIYFGSSVPGAGFSSPSYDGAGTPPGQYPPALGESGCLALSATGNLANFAYIGAIALQSGFVPQILLEDSANNVLYFLTNSGQNGFGGALPGVSLKYTLPIPAADGAGPIYVGDFNGDHNTDFIINGQAGFSASVYLGNGNGTFQQPVRYTFDKHVHSMLLHDMDGDGLQDMVVEGDNGVIEIFKGKPDGTFATTSMGGTPAGVDGFSGNGGHLAAIDPATLNILTTTPIGLSVLKRQGSTLIYDTLQGIYDIGPGRSSFALADFYGTGQLAFAVDSPEGIAIALGDSNGDGGFQTARAYPALAPVLGTTVGKFRNTGNPAGNVDVVADTGAEQGQLLVGDGKAGFQALNRVTNPTPPTTPPANNVPAGLWSNILSGDFDGDGKRDILYSLTGIPQPGPSLTTVPVVYIQFGNGDGTFVSPGFTFYDILPPGPLNGAYGESAVGDFNGDGLSDLAFINQYAYAAFLFTPARVFGGPNFSQNFANPAFSNVAAGFFKTGRSNKQDLIFQQGSSLIPYLNSGNGVNFTAMPALSGTPSAPPLYASTVLLSDLDGDGNGDVIAVYYNSLNTVVGASPVAPNQLYIWYGHGDGTFDAPQIIQLSRNDYLGAISDMNFDGLPDIVLADDSLVTALYNQGARSFGGEQHFLAGQGINSLSVADVNGDGTPDLIVGNGGTTLSNAFALGGATKSSLSLTPNADVNTGGITVLANNVTTQPVTGTLVVVPEPSNLGATFTMIATITPSLGVALPTGFVTFTIDGTVVGNPIALVPGTTNSTATYVVPAGNTYAAGTHAVVANYQGDTNNSSFTVNATHQIVNAIQPVTGTVAASPEPSNLAATFTLTATVVSAAGVAVPTGSVTFSIDGVQVGSAVALVPGATSSTASLIVPAGNPYAIGSHAIGASYAGDANNAATNLSATHAIVNNTSTTVLALCVGPTPTCPSNGFVSPPYTPTLTMSYGQTWNGVVTVTASDGALLTGSTLINLVYNGGPVTTICTLNTAIAGAACPAAVGTTIGTSIGVNVLTSVYSGNATHTGSTSAPVTITVLADTTTAAVTGTPNPSPVGQPVTFTATLTGSFAPPTGSVVFLDGGTTIGTATLVPGASGVSSIATLTTSTLAVGTHPITVSYAATTNFGAAASPVFTETITPLLSGSFTLSVSPNPTTIGLGYSAGFTVTVTPKNGFTQDVNLSCGTMPYEMACTFVKPAITGGGGATTLFVGTTSPHTCGTTQPYFLGSNGSPLLPLAMPALAGLLVGFFPGKRRWLRSLMTIIVVTVASQISGCGSCTDLGTKPGTYTFTVSGAAVGGPAETESQTVTLNVAI